MANQTFEEITLNIKELIEFYDCKEKGLTKPASSISGLIGEDLIAGLFKHYLEKCDKKTVTVKIDDVSIKATGKEGKMLDRWIIQENNDGTKIAYQTEIKNWSAHSLGGYDLSSKKGDKKQDIFSVNQDVIKIGKKNFKNTWGVNPKNESEGGFKDNSVGKVLLKMNSEVYTKENGYDVKPLVCFWMPICDILENDLDSNIHFFKKKCSKIAIDSGRETKKGKVYFNMILGDVKTDKCGNFEEVYFFSASIYLRSILKNNPEKDFIDISSNNINSRINYLKNLIVKF